MLTIPIIKNKISPICKRYGIAKAYLFGSYSRNDAHENSDVDLYIEPGAVQDLFIMSELRLDIMDARGTEVDLISELPESEVFKKNLARDKMLLYEA